MKMIIVIGLSPDRNRLVLGHPASGGGTGFASDLALNVVGWRKHFMGSRERGTVARRKWIVLLKTGASALWFEFSTSIIPPELLF